MDEFMVRLEIGTSYEFSFSILRIPTYFEMDVDVAKLISR